MEPVSTAIVSALVAGATAALKDVATKAIKDAYDALKTLITSRYTKVHVELVEEEPDSEARQSVLAQDLQKSGAVADQEVVAKARELLHLIENEPADSQAARAIDMERVRAASIRLKDIEASGTAVRARDVEVRGAFEAEGIRAGVTKEGGAKKT